MKLSLWEFHISPVQRSRLSVLPSSQDNGKITSQADSMEAAHIQSMGKVPPCLLRHFFPFQVVNQLAVNWLASSY